MKISYYSKLWMVIFITTSFSSVMAHDVVALDELFYGFGLWMLRRLFRWHVAVRNVFPQEIPLITRLGFGQVPRELINPEVAFLLGCAVAFDAVFARELSDVFRNVRRER